MTKEQTIQAIIDKACERSRLAKVQTVLRTDAGVRRVIETSVGESQDVAEDIIEATALTIALYCTEQLVLALLGPTK